MDRPVPERTLKSKAPIETEELAAGDHSEAFSARLQELRLSQETASAAEEDEGLDDADRVPLGAHIRIHSAHAVQAVGSVREMGPPDHSKASARLQESRLSPETAGAAVEDEGLDDADSVELGAPTIIYSAHTVQALGSVPGMGPSDHSEAISARLQGVSVSPATKGAAVAGESRNRAEMLELVAGIMPGDYAGRGAASGLEMEAAHEHEVTRGAAKVGAAHLRVSDSWASDECANSQPLDVESLFASFKASLPVSTYTETVDPHTPPPVPSFRSLEPTRLTCNAEAHSVRDHTLLALDELYCVIQEKQGWHIVAEVYVKYAATRFAVQMFTGVDGRVIVEWVKIEGCTLAFCDTYRAFARDCITNRKELSAHDVSGFADVEKSYAEQQDLPPLVLPTEDTDYKQTLAPVLAMLQSEWSTSQREGCCVVATLSDSGQNTKQLIASQVLPLLAKHLQSRDRHTVRCAAAAIANLASGASEIGPPEAVVLQFQSTTPRLTHAARNVQCAQTRVECNRALDAVRTLQSGHVGSGEDSL